MANPLGNDCENANTHTHGGVGTFTKEMKLELMWINSAMKRRREGFETPPVECPPVECRQSDSATDALYRKDRVSQSGPDAGHMVTGHWVLRPVSGDREHAGVGLRLDAGVRSENKLIAKTLASVY